MLAQRELTVASLAGTARWHTALGYAIFTAGALGLCGLAELGGTLTTGLLLIALLSIAACAVIFWRPVLGLYASIFLDIAMDPEIVGDPISKYTQYFQTDLNGFVHIGVPLSTLNILVFVTTLAYLLRALDKRVFHGGSLGRHVLAFGLFLAFGYVWGRATNGNSTVAFFEVRGLLMLVVVYYAVTNLAVEQHQIQRLLGLVVGSLALLAAWDLLRLIIFFHGNSGGADGEYGHNHEDAVMLGWFFMIWLLRLLFGGTRRQKLGLGLLAIAAIIVVFEMERRAAFSCLFFAATMLAIALFVLRRRLFFRVTPVVIVLILVYAAAFWNSSSALAQPIRAWRSQSTTSDLGSRDYNSNEYRVQEKANVRDTIMTAPLTGIGFGQKFLFTHQMVVLDWWVTQFYTPHAQILWIWLKVGAGGFIAFWVVMCTALARAADGVRRGGVRAAYTYLVPATFIVMILGFAYVDVGLVPTRCTVLVGAMLGVIGAASRLPASASGEKGAAPS